MLILPVQRQEVKAIGPSPFEVSVRSREEEPAGSTDRTIITDRLGHNLDISLQELQTRLMIPDVDYFGLSLRRRSFYKVSFCINGI